MRVSKRSLVVFLSISVDVIALGVVSRKYISLYVSRKSDPRPLVADLLGDPEASKNPETETLLTEANRLFWLFNWPKAEALYVRSEELFKERSDTRNEIYARVDRIRAQAETMSWVDVSEMLGQQLEIPVVKSDPKLRLWCLVAKGYTDLEINLASAKRALAEAQGIAHTLGEAKWEARARGELGIIAFLEGDSRRAAEIIAPSARLVVRPRTMTVKKTLSCLCLSRRQPGACTVSSSGKSAKTRRCFTLPRTGCTLMPELMLPLTTVCAKYFSKILSALSPRSLIPYSVPEPLRASQSAS